MRKIMLCLIAALFFCLPIPEAWAENALTMPEELTVIADEAFMGDRSVKSVVLPEGILSIGARAFANSSLEEIFLPDSLTFIAEDAFDGCTALTISAYSGSPGHIWCEKQNIPCNVIATPVSQFKYTRTDGGIEITKYSGTDTEVFVPAVIDNLPVVAIGDKAFQYNQDITRVRLPDSITRIGEKAFDTCTEVTSFRLPAQLETIGAHAFMACRSADGFYLPDNVASIGEGTFYYTDTPVYCRAGSLTASTYTDYYFACSSPTVNWHKGFISPAFPDYSLMQFADEAGNPTLTAIKYFGTGGDVLIPSEIGGTPLTTLGEYAFSARKDILSFTIPDSITKIDASAFDECVNLKTVYLPDHISSIGRSAFSDTDPVVYCHAGTATANAVSSYIGNNFAHVGDYLEGFTSPSCPDYLLLQSIDGQGAPCLKILAYCGVGSELSVPAAIDGARIDVIGESSFNVNQLTRISLPEGISEIQKYAFCNPNLLSINIPSSVRSIGAYTFSGCSSLKSIIIPEGVDNLSWNCFYGCTSLETVILPDSLTSVGDHTFAKCASLKSIDLPENVRWLGSYAFSESGLTSITLPASLEKIYSSCFSNSPLKSAVFLGGDTVLDSQAFIFTRSVAFYCPENSAVHARLVDLGYTPLPLNEADFPG